MKTVVDGLVSAVLLCIALILTCFIVYPIPSILVTLTIIVIFVVRWLRKIQNSEKETR